MSYIFNKITVRPQLPKRIEKLEEISYNLWWSWNTEFLKIFKDMDCDLWERSEKNPVLFLKNVSQEKLEEASNNQEFLKLYDSIVKKFEDYMNSKNTYFAKKYPENKEDLIAYYSAEYGLDETVSIYAGGLGVLSGDHLKTASDLGVPLVGVGMLYKNGYFHQKISGNGDQQIEYKSVDISTLPVKPVKTPRGKDLIFSFKLLGKKLYIKVWQINVGRNKLYLMDSDIEENSEENRALTSTLYGGDKENRIKQEIILGIGGTKMLYELGIKPTVYHMNEGHSAFMSIELIKDFMKYKEVSFDIARDMASSMTVFTTHTPIAAGNDIFPMEYIEKYFKGYWTRFGITKEEFLRLGVRESDSLESGFNMGVFALKIAGKKNGVSKLHGEVSREIFGDIWPDVPGNESPIGYVTNGIHVCSWTSPTMKNLYNKYFIPYWQDNVYDDNVWKKVYDIPDEELWAVHQARKERMLQVIKDRTTKRLRRENFDYEMIDKIVGNLDPNVLTIGFARRFATYKRATLIFRDLERITKIFNEKNMPVQIIFAGKGHPHDVEGSNLIKYIHELSLKPQFIGKIFVLEDYNIGMSRYLVSGVDVWLNTPRRPMEASGTSGQKAAVNGVINFSIKDGWWDEGYNQHNGWAIGTSERYQNYEDQDDADSKSLYDVLENKIMPMYYNKNENNYSEDWLKVMKESIATNSGRYSTARMLIDYLDKMYIPLANLRRKYYDDLDIVSSLNEWKSRMYKHFREIKIFQDENNLNNATVDAGNRILVNCNVQFPEKFIKPEDVDIQVYCGKIKDGGIIDEIKIDSMECDGFENGMYKYSTSIEMKSGGDYGYTFRAIPKNKMISDTMNMNLIRWVKD